MTYHIRQRLRRRGGSQFYLDRSERKPTTFCGAKCGECDASWSDAPRHYVERRKADGYGRDLEPCEECRRLCAEYNAARKATRKARKN